jgi:hypothetical protein
MEQRLIQEGNTLFEWLYNTYLDREATVSNDDLDAFIAKKEMESTRQELVKALQSADVLQSLGGLAVKLTYTGEIVCRKGKLPL